jgi:hypothetical protein
LAGIFPLHLMGGQPAQLVIDQRQQLAGRLLVAAFHLLQHHCKITHANMNNGFQARNEAWNGRCAGTNITGQSGSFLPHGFRIRLAVQKHFLDSRTTGRRRRHLHRQIAGGVAVFSATK